MRKRLFTEDKFPRPVRRGEKNLCIVAVDVRRLYIFGWKLEPPHVGCYRQGLQMRPFYPKNALVNAPVPAMLRGLL